MGWTTLYRVPGLSDREFFENEFPAMLMAESDSAEATEGE
jgi:hypothetical protein